uniref:Histone deacetylase complex subunit SAP130 C-terminal domain-containing protein n=1 Tax=Timema bartmani TaxID=61472 RepID=A0A7R9EWV3_9NEOP|nr:unnamed protein product [Timema bartmani]
MKTKDKSPMKAQKNLTPMLTALSSSPVSPPSPRRPDSRGNGGNSSGGSTTISATSSPGLNEAGEDSLPAIVKNEIVDEIEKPPVEMSPRKKPRKQQLQPGLHSTPGHQGPGQFLGQYLKSSNPRTLKDGMIRIRPDTREVRINSSPLPVYTGMTGTGGSTCLPPIQGGSRSCLLPLTKETLSSPLFLVYMGMKLRPLRMGKTGNELPEPKFSDEEMEFLPEEKLREVKEDSRDELIVLTVAATAMHEEPEEKVFVPKRPHISLINSYRHPWKSKHNHFIRYSDVKPKDERRPTITDLGNQKNVLQKLNGWKIFHLSTQMEDLADVETQAIEKLSAILKVMERKTGKELEKDVNRSNELIKGNMQRSKIIKDQMKEAESQVMKIFDHKGHATDIVNKCANKRSLKKREKL